MKLLIGRRQILHPERATLLRALSCVFLLVILLAAKAASAQQQTPASSRILLTDSRVALLGRYDPKSRESVRFGYPGSGFAVQFDGRYLTVALYADSDRSALVVVVDHGEPRLILLPKGESSPVLADFPQPAHHLVQVYKSNETWEGILTLSAIVLGPQDTLLAAPPQPLRKLLFVGDSVTCGGGIAENAQCTADPLHPAGNGYYTFGMELGRRLDARVDLVCYGGRGVVRDYRGLALKDGVLNAPDFLNLSIPADDPRARSLWISHDDHPDAVIVSLGTNDFNLQKTQPLDEESYVRAWAALLKRIAGQYRNAQIFATEGAIVTDPLLRHYIRTAVARMHESRIMWMPATHYPGNGCNAHPTLDQHRQIANDMEPILRKRLQW